MNKAGMNNSAVSLGILRGLVMDSVKVFKSFVDFAKTFCTILKFKLNNDRYYLLRLYNVFHQWHLPAINGKTDLLAIVIYSFPVQCIGVPEPFSLMLNKKNLLQVINLHIPALAGIILHQCGNNICFKQVL